MPQHRHQVGCERPLIGLFCDDTTGGARWRSWTPRAMSSWMVSDAYDTAKDVVSSGYDAATDAVSDAWNWPTK